MLNESLPTIITRIIAWNVTMDNVPYEKKDKTTQANVTQGGASSCLKTTLWRVARPEVRLKKLYFSSKTGYMIGFK